MIGQWVAPLMECGVGTALEALRSSGLERAPMTQALTADTMRHGLRDAGARAQLDAMGLLDGKKPVRESDDEPTPPRSSPVPTTKRPPAK